jgi:hypothetical protein
MDFGISFLSNNVMLPILDFFYGIVPSYGLAIVALTLVIRFALFPLNAGSIRNMRRMRITQPLMKKRQEEIQKLYKDDQGQTAGGNEQALQRVWQPPGWVFTSAVANAGFVCAVCYLAGVPVFRRKLLRQPPNLSPENK